MNSEEKNQINNSEQKFINTDIHINKENKQILYLLANTGQCYAKLSYKSHKYYDKIQIAGAA